MFAGSGTVETCDTLKIDVRRLEQVCRSRGLRWKLFYVTISLACFVHTPNQFHGRSTRSLTAVESSFARGAN